MQKEKLEKIILSIVGGIITAVILMAFIFSPNLKRISQLRAKIREEKDKVVRAEKEALGLARMKLNLIRLEDQIEEYQRNMPQATPEWLLERLNTFAYETGVDFDKIEPKGYMEEIGPYHLQGLYIELRTDYHRLGRFISRLEKLTPFLKVLDLSIAGNKDDVNRHIVKITVGAYVKKT